jgi:hypothetical protein
MALPRKSGRGPACPALRVARCPDRIRIFAFAFCFFKSDAIFALIFSYFRDSADCFEKARIL